ncbi:hypothetical protein BKA64DRAFT_239139 [Cadophora sp. MPI-SDFR-AT-0126]|nr:hypothetical protein BKA64DRAFT_239139 [Leotiomycetes sp. MPI-SDFR-AT-0126]
MDYDFFDDLFLSQEDFAHLTPHCGPSGDVNDFDDIWNQDDHEDPTSIQGGAGDFSSCWNQFMVGHEQNSPVNQSKIIEQPATNEALFPLLRFPASELELDSEFSPFLWTPEFHEDPSNSTVPPFFAISTLDEATLQALGRNEASPRILTPTTSNASSENEMRVFDQNSKSEMPSNYVFPTIEDVDSSWLSPGQPHHQDQDQQRWLH